METRHRVHAAVVDVHGRVLAQAGDPELVTFWRSGAKPFQAVPLVEDGAAERFAITAPELALCCASHSSEPVQVQYVRDLLAKIGCGEGDLVCGPHPPLSERVARDYAAAGVRLTPIFSNCSGNHAGMLALACHRGWPVASYARLEHPVQQRCLAAVSQWAGVPIGAIGTAVDGCGVVCFALPLRNMAWAYAKLAVGLDQRGSQTPHVVLVEAVLRHPELIAGEGRPCTTMMRAHPGRVVTKVGAGGVYCGLLTREGLGIALKVADGSGAAAAIAMATLLADLGLRPQPDTLMSQRILNTRGEA
ncbi:MAG: asparaginase, partial [Gemmatimonadaceae bacterium]